MADTVLGIDNVALDSKVSGGTKILSGGVTSLEIASN